MKKIRNRKDLQITDLLIAHGPAGYGVYVMLTQYLSERKSLRRREDIARIAYELHAPAEMVRSVLEDFGLFVLTDDGEFTNEQPSPVKSRKRPEKPAEEPEKEPIEEPTDPHLPSKRKIKGKISVKKLLKSPSTLNKGNDKSVLTPKETHQKKNTSDLLLWQQKALKAHKRKRTS